MHEDAYKIIQETIADVMPDRAVAGCMKNLEFTGRVYVVAIGKAAWPMAKTAAKILGGRLEKGIIVTKYQHARERI